MKGKLAIIDDDEPFLESITLYLQGRGYDAQKFSSYYDAKQNVRSEYVAAIVDLHLADGDGIDLIGFFHQTFPALKIIVITGRDTLPKRLKSFGLGADDYLLKPIFPVELEARLKRFFRLETKHDEVQLDAKNYTRTEASVMKLLLQAKGIPVSLETFLKDGLTRSAVYTCLSRLRSKIANEYEIKSAYGRGYYLKVVKH